MRSLSCCKLSQQRAGHALWCRGLPLPHRLQRLQAGCLASSLHLLHPSCRGNAWQLLAIGSRCAGCEQLQRHSSSTQLDW